MHFYPQKNSNKPLTNRLYGGYNHFINNRIFGDIIMKRVNHIANYWYWCYFTENGGYAAVA